MPVCFALVSDRAVSAVDHKPKRTMQLGRLRDIRETGRAVLLVDHYSDDWSQLWWIRITGPAAVHAATIRSTPRRGRPWRPSTTSTGTARRPDRCGQSPWTRCAGGRPRDAGPD